MGRRRDGCGSSGRRDELSDPLLAELVEEYRAQSDAETPQLLRVVNCGLAWHQLPCAVALASLHGDLAVSHVLKHEIC